MHVSYPFIVVLDCPFLGLPDFTSQVLALNDQVKFCNAIVEFFLSIQSYLFSQLKKSWVAILKCLCKLYGKPCEVNNTRSTSTKT